MTATTAPGQLRIAVVGAGVSGLAVTKNLRAQEPLAHVDVLDRELVPFGLLRTGVAPDHESQLKVREEFAPVFDDPAVRFLGGVQFGRDVSRAELLSAYDAVVYATGAEHDRLLGVPGEDLPGARSGRDFARWYTGGAPAFDLTGVVNAVIVGLGDVAMDLARILLKDPAEFARTDMPAAVLQHLTEHRVRTVTVLVRGGLEDCQLKPRDLQELLNLPGVGVRFDPAVLDADLSEASEKVQQGLPLWRAAAEREVTGAKARLKIRFWTRPLEFRGEGHVDGVRIEKTARDKAGRLVSAGGEDMIPAQLVLRAIGARSLELPDVPYDPETGRIPTASHRVVDQQGVVQTGEYATGWVANGWIGGFGSQRRDGAAVADQIVADLALHSHGLDAVLAQRGVQPVGIEGWRAVRAREAELGARQGRPSARFDDPAETEAVARGLR